MFLTSPHEHFFTIAYRPVEVIALYAVALAPAAELSQRCGNSGADGYDTYID